ncbi:hypothetical protein [Sphingomonas sp. PAMC 26605]|uniref:hypothetical protein n=1 Tax=Sphingomonas sp. PAMC 26605 TaxID=1112214 RepID=UPI0012F4D1B8|nr:hypothetical protein [Sphingomonas sp. PAMC 26605]
MLVTFAAFRSSPRKRSAVRYRAEKEVAVDVAKGVPFATAATALASESECGDTFRSLALHVMVSVSATADHLQRMFPLEIDAGSKRLVAFDSMAPHIRVADLGFHRNCSRGGNARGHDHQRDPFHFFLHGENPTGQETTRRITDAKAAFAGRLRWRSVSFVTQNAGPMMRYNSPKAISQGARRKRVNRDAKIKSFASSRGYADRHEAA